jgi:hypothetical protein
MVKNDRLAAEKLQSQNLARGRDELRRAKNEFT